MTRIIEEQLVVIIKLENENKILLKSIEESREEYNKLNNIITELMNKQERLKLDVANAWNKLKELLIKE